MRVQDRDIEVLRCLDYHVRSKGYAITIRELGEALGLRSSSSVHSIVSNMRQRGLVSSVEGDRRTLHCTLAGLERLAGGE